ncbi:MAG: AzlC family ABC transporter permease [Clostridia bacterium]|nr:AzlC family ABC transporter permease [Clostridia bacterium]
MDFKNGLKDGIPIALGYFSVSVAFGVLAIQGGLSWLESVMISLFNLTSAGQKAGLDIIIAGGTLVEIALSQLLINARYSLMGISLSQKLDKKFSSPYRLVLGFAITDEIFAVASSKKIVSRSYLAGLAILPIIGWSGGTLFGALLGGIMPAIIQSALGVALYGMFIAVFIPAAKEEKSVLCVVGIAIACSCMMYYLPLLNNISSGFAVIICTLIAASIGAVLFPREEEEDDAV